MYLALSTEIQETVCTTLPGDEDDDIWDDEDEIFDDWMEDEDDLHEIKTGNREFGEIDPEDDDHLPDDDLQ